jgi:hypothetical protein
MMKIVSLAPEVLWWLKNIKKVMKLLWR